MLPEQANREKGEHSYDTISSLTVGGWYTSNAGQGPHRAFVLCERKIESEQPLWRQQGVLGAGNHFTKHSDPIDSRRLVPFRFVDQSKRLVPLP